MSRITLSIIIDNKYIEPALVTLITLLNFKKFYKAIKLVLIKKNLDDLNDTAEILNLLNNFKEIFDTFNIIQVSVIEDKLPEFNKFHFTNAILYKIFAPIIFSEEEFILNVDAGIIFLPKFSEFSENLNKKLEHSTDFTIGAFLESSMNLMPAEVSKYSIYYPSGQILLFNSKKYLQDKIAERVIKFYTEKAIYLNYAEQEILCAILEDSDFFEFKGIENIYLDDLSSFTGNSYYPIDYIKLKNSIYYKNQGSIKPWKSWNLNPNKVIYLKIREEICKRIDLNQYGLINKEREAIEEKLIAFKAANLLSYENYLISKTTEM